MSRKIKPEDQTKELSTAMWEFLQRNPMKKDDQKTEYLLDIHNYLITVRWYKEAFEDFLKRSQCRPAADTSLVMRETRIKTWLERGGSEEDDEFMDHWKREILKNAEKMVRELIPGKPNTTLVISIDLTRSTKAIEKEVAALVSKAKRKVKETRIKWLSIIDELLAVWDAWVGYSQRRCFKLIAKQLNIPESTVKDRWRLAYRLINGQEYSREVAAGEADALCARCKDQKKCYQTVGGKMEFYPCHEYLKLAGKNCTREKLLENFDAVADQYIFKNYQD